MHKHSRLAIPAGYLDAQGLAPKLSPYSSWSHGLRFEHLHPHPIAQMSLETVAFAAGSTSSGCVLLTSYHILTKHSVSHWWFPMLKISPILPPPASPPETSSQARDDSPPSPQVSTSRNKIYCVCGISMTE